MFIYNTHPCSAETTRSTKQTRLANQTWISFASPLPKMGSSSSTGESAPFILVRSFSKDGGEALADPKDSTIARTRHAHAATQVVDGALPLLRVDENTIMLHAFLRRMFIFFCNCWLICSRVCMTDWCMHDLEVISKEICFGWNTMRHVMVKHNPELLAVQLWS